MLKEPLMTNYEMEQPGVQKIVKYFEERLQTLREKNDNPKADRLTRGRIAEIKTFNILMNPKTPVEMKTLNDAM